MAALPHGYNTAELTFGMYHDNAVCLITVVVSGRTLFSQSHSAEKQRLRFKYHMSDSLTIGQEGSDGTCMVHLHSLRVLNTRSDGAESRSSCSYVYDRGSSSWPSLPAGLVSGMPPRDSIDVNLAWLLS